MIRRCVQAAFSFASRAEQFPPEPRPRVPMLRIIRFVLAAAVILPGAVACKSARQSAPVRKAAAISPSASRAARTSASIAPQSGSQAAEPTRKVSPPSGSRRTATAPALPAPPAPAMPVSKPSDEGVANSLPERKPESAAESPASSGQAAVASNWKKSSTLGALGSNFERTEPSKAASAEPGRSSVTSLLSTVQPEASESAPLANAPAEEAPIGPPASSRQQEKRPPDPEFNSNAPWFALP